MHMGYSVFRGEQIMSDDVSMFLTFPSIFDITVHPYLEDEASSLNTSYDGLLEYRIYDVRNGELDFLHEFIALGIPYDISWESGTVISAGSEYCRFTPDGKVHIKTLFDNEINPDIHELEKRIDFPDRLRNYILRHKESRKVPGWENQVEYGKIYRTHKLLVPK